MTLTNLAALHCANYNTDGSCVGAMIDDDLQIRVCRPKPKCLLNTAGVRCRYFEECVMPMNSSDWPELRTPQQHEEFARLVHLYRRAANVPSQNGRRCGCGRELEPRKRMCYQCRQKARRSSYRDSKRKTRVPCPQLSQKTPRIP